MALGLPGTVRISFGTLDLRPICNFLFSDGVPYIVYWALSVQYGPGPYAIPNLLIEGESRFWRWPGEFIQPWATAEASA